MNKLIALLFGLFIYIPIHAQEFIVVDENTKEPLAYATIIFPQINKGTYADNNGKFIIPTEHEYKDSICIQMVGYDNFRTTISRLSDTIFLVQAVYTLQEIIVIPKGKEIKLGDLKKKKKKEIYISYKDTVFIPIIFATYIAGKDYSGCEIKKLHYRYDHPNPKIRYIVRPQLYIVSEDGKPGNTLLRQSQILEITGSGILEVDISDEQILLPNDGVFIGIEVIEEISSEPLDIKDKRNPISLNYVSTKGAETYLASFDDFRWVSFDWTEEKMYLRAPFAISINCPK